MDEKTLKWFNKKQLEAMLVGANTEYIIASRGFGKSEGIDAPRLLRNIFAMPRSSGALLSPTYAKLLSNTLPAVCHALERFGFKRDVHYFVGRKPPLEMNFKTPYINPFRYDYVMSWFNGSILHFLSFDRPMSANSLSLDYLLGFEAKYLNYDKIINEVIPANRGNEQYFSSCPWHHGMVFTTDMPTSKSGMWIFEKEKEMDKELISTIKSVQNEIITLRQKETNINRLQSLERDLSLFRKNATFYAEYDIFDNLELIGEKRIRDFKRDLPPLIFQTAILNKRMNKVANGFYASFSEKIHCYQAVYDNSYLDGLEYNFKKTIHPDCRADADMDRTLPLIIANDYNAAINSMVTAQHIGNELRTLKSMFVKTPRKLMDIVNDWCDYYEYHPTKEVVYYFDATAIYANSISGDSFADVVLSTLRKRGWNVQEIYIGQPIRHTLKHLYIDIAFKGSTSDDNTKYTFPTFNADNNEYLILAMEQTGVKQGRNGFEKDKSAEKLLDSPEMPDEVKTHITDAWDTLFIGVNQYPYTRASSLYSGNQY